MDQEKDLPLNQAQKDWYEDLLMMTAEKVVECRVTMSKGKLYHSAQLLRKHTMQIMAAEIKLKEAYSEEELSESESGSNNDGDSILLLLL